MSYTCKITPAHGIMALGADQADVEGTHGAESGTQLLLGPTATQGDDTLAARYVRSLCQAGASALISNVDCTAMLMRHGRWSFPVMKTDGDYGGSYVASAHSNYVLYARDELDIIGVKAGRTAAKGVLGALDFLLRKLDINRAVYLDNWLLSTSLHGDWRGEGLPAMRTELCARFPDHVPIIRSLDLWSCPELIEAVRADGWLVMPARQIWVTDDLRRNWKKRNNVQNDRRALSKSGLSVEQSAKIRMDDAERIANLYRQLYMGRYSTINPQFSAHFVHEAARIGLLHFRLARDTDGVIMAACGMRATGGTATVPFLGYDLNRPQSEGLYRIASYLASEWAMERDLRFNGSAGAGEFKRMRGARPEMEYMAVYADHLPHLRREGLALLAAGLNRVMTPLLTKQGW